jgi:hypothetical protein
MPLLRFATVRDLYEAFETARDDIGVEASDEPSLAFLQSLAAAQAWDKAISFCAYLLPRRAAIWWGCQSLRRMTQLTPPEADILAVAEAWVREPEEERRRAALDLGHGDPRLPATWMALAAGWSGGNIVPPQMGIVPAPPHQTARAVRAGLLMATAQIPAENFASVMQGCIDAGMQLAASEQSTA